jgi:hypothetical protein
MTDVVSKNACWKGVLTCCLWAICEVEAKGAKMRSVARSKKMHWRNMDGWEGWDESELKEGDSCQGLLSGRVKTVNGVSWMATSLRVGPLTRVRAPIWAKPGYLFW